MGKRVVRRWEETRRSAEQSEGSKERSRVAARPNVQSEVRPGRPPLLTIDTGASRGAVGGKGHGFDCVALAAVKVHGAAVVAGGTGGADVVDRLNDELHPAKLRVLMLRKVLRPRPQGPHVAVHVARVQLVHDSGQASWRSWRVERFACDEAINSFPG